LDTTRNERDKLYKRWLKICFTTLTNATESLLFSAECVEKDAFPRSVAVEGVAPIRNAPKKMFCLAKDPETLKPPPQKTLTSTLIQLQARTEPKPVTKITPQKKTEPKQTDRIVFFSYIYKFFVSLLK